MSAIDRAERLKLENRLKVVGQLAILEFADAGLVHELQAQALASVYEGAGLLPDELFSVTVDILRRVQELQATNAIWPGLLPGPPGRASLIHPDIAEVIDIVSNTRVHSAKRLVVLTTWLKDKGWMSRDTKCGAHLEVVYDFEEEAYVYCELDEHGPEVKHTGTINTERYYW